MKKVNKNKMESKLVVVKIGGAKDINVLAVCEDVAKLHCQAFQVVLVHGGSERANRLALEKGHPARFIQSPSGYVSRYTDLLTRDIYVEAMKSLNQEIAQELFGLGVSTIGLTTFDNCVLLGERKRNVRAVINGRVRVIHDDYSGRITQVRGSILSEALNQGKVPIVPSLSYSQEDGFLNVDGDRVAASISGALSADTMVLLSNVSGLYRNYADQGSLVSEVPRSQLDLALDWAEGRMKRKIKSVREALDLGVAQAAVADGRMPQPLQRALAGGGTWFV